MAVAETDFLLNADHFQDHQYGSEACPGWLETFTICFPREVAYEMFERTT